MISNVRTRFAPSPTGYMHIGNLRTALYAYLFAKHHNGTFILRIEDTDQKRYVEGSADIIYKTLKTAGLNHDEGPDKGGKFGPYIQSERKDIYKKYALELIDKGSAYYCFCNKNDVDDEAEISQHSFTHSCSCQSLSKAEINAKLKTEKYAIRQVIPKNGTTTFYDEVFGNITVKNNVLDEQVLLKSDGFPTYNLANVVDDHLMEISHVIRAKEYLPSAPKYQLLYEAFGWTPPKTIHLSLINGKDEDGTVSKLSKRHGSVSFDDLVKQGFLPEAILNYTALLGWSPKQEQEIFSLKELTELFTTDGIIKTDAIFDYKKLEWMNSIYIKNMPYDDFLNSSESYLSDAPDFVKKEWTLASKLAQGRISKFSEIKTLFNFLSIYNNFDLNLLENKKNKSTKEFARTVLTDLIKNFENLTSWNVENLNAIAEKYSTEKQLKLGAVMWPLRIAVTGETVTPGGMGEMMQLLGKEESIKRLNKTINRLA